MDNRDMRLLKKQLPETLAQRLALGSGVGEVLDTGDMRLYRYGTGNTVDLDLYRALQTAANKMKSNSQAPQPITGFCQFDLGLLGHWAP